MPTMLNQHHPQGKPPPASFDRTDAHLDTAPDPVGRDVEPGAARRFQFL